MADMNAPTEKPLRVAGVMTGTSMDGIDLVVAEFVERSGLLDWRIIGREHGELPDVVRTATAAAATRPLDAVTYAQIEAELSTAVAQVAIRARRAVDFTLLGVHGQTIWHRPPPLEPAHTHQILDPYRIAQAVGVPVVWDFRRADVAAGGQGAPLAPWAHLRLFAARAGANSAFLNLGGIANVTRVPDPADVDSVRAWDTGPGMMLLDQGAREFLGTAWDAGGAVALTGSAREDVVRKALTDPWFLRPPPKSTGREAFGAQYYHTLVHSGHFVGATAADILRTLAALTAAAVAADLAAWPPPDNLYVMGGGARNRAVLAELAARLPRTSIADIAVLGAEPEDVEALAFALLAWERHFERPANLPAVTGAARPVVLGSIARP